MKTLLTILFAILCLGVFGQKEPKMRTIHPFDAKQEPVVFTYVIGGLICIDNEKPFKNDTCTNPIVFKVTLEGIEISQGDRRFEYSECDHYGCKYIHLRENIPWIRGSINAPGIYLNGNITPTYPR
jgi:hypothetical protein